MAPGEITAETRYAANGEAHEYLWFTGGCRIWMMTVAVFSLRFLTLGR